VSAKRIQLQKKALQARKNKAAAVVDGLKSHQRRQCGDVRKTPCDSEMNFHENLSVHKSTTTQRSLQYSLGKRHSHHTFEKIDRQVERDEQERERYLKQKRDEKLNMIKKEREVERFKMASKLANMHYMVNLMKRSLNLWGSIVEEQHLKMMKADEYRNDYLREACIRGLLENVEYKRKNALTIERQAFLKAGKYQNNIKTTTLFIKIDFSLLTPLT